jgi:hypothetical protein
MAFCSISNFLFIFPRFLAEPLKYCTEPRLGNTGLIYEQAPSTRNSVLTYTFFFAYSLAHSRPSADFVERDALACKSEARLHRIQERELEPLLSLCEWLPL